MQLQSDEEIAAVAFNDYAHEYLSERTGLGIGFSGAHRVGKSTIAARLAEKNKFPFIPSSVSAIAKECGFDMNNPATPFLERIAFQEVVLEAFAREYEEQTGIFIADRTPLDLAMYLLADAPNGASTPEIGERVTAYVDRCVQLANDHFMCVMIVQPGIEFVEGEGKPLPNVPYQEKVNAIVVGLARTRLKRNYVIFDRTLTDLSKRTSAAASVAATALSNFDRMLRTMPMN